MQAISNHLLSLVLFAPLGGALGILLVGRRRVAAVRWIASASATLSLLLALPLWFKYDPHGKTWQFAERAELVPALGVSYYVGVDGFSILMILLTSLISWIAVQASWHEIRPNVRAFYALLLVLQAGLLGVFTALDFVQVFLFWSIVLIAMYLLIRRSDERRPPRSSFRFAIHAFAASAAVLAGIFVLYFAHHAETGVFSFDISQFHTLRLPAATQNWAFLVFFLGFAATSALFPLHSWLPDAQADSPTAASLMLAAVVLKIGAYGFVRFNLAILPDATRLFAPGIAVIALVALVCGAVFVWAQRDWRRLVAYSSVCHMALITLAAFALTPGSVSGSMLHQTNHGIATAGLLLVVALRHRRTDPVSLTPTGARRNTMPLFATVFLVMVLSFAGLPALNGFVGEIMILRGVYAANKLCAAVAAIALVFVFASTLLLYRRTLLEGASASAAVRVRDLTAHEIGMVAPLVALALWIGVHPAPFVATLETSMGRVVARVNPVYGPSLAQGSDCATPAPAEPSAPPPSFMLTESCADGSDAKAKPSPPDGSRR